MCYFEYERGCEIVLSAEFTTQSTTQDSIQASLLNTHWTLTEYSLNNQWVLSEYYWDIWCREVILIFKGFKNIPLPYNKQALIRYTCLDYNDQPQNMQQKIDMLCSEIAQGEASALFKVNG